MPENRFFHPSLFVQGQKIVLKSSDELHHLKVMRIDVGERVELVNGQHQLANAVLISLEKQGATFFLDAVHTAPPPSRQLILAQGLLKPKNLDLVIEKGTELGATAFWLFPGERSEKKELTKNQLERLHHLSISALKQSGRLDLPKIDLMPPLGKWPPLPHNTYFGDLHSPQHLPPAPSDLIFIIGPEKGFSLNEETLLHSFSIGIRLNPNILRAETAAIAALSIIQGTNQE